MKRAGVPRLGGAERGAGVRRVGTAEGGTLARRASLLAGIACACLTLLGPTASAAPPTTNIFIAGDSTAAEYTPDRYPQLGWGMVLKCAFGDDVAVHDYAKSGRSSKSFITQGFFSQIEREIQKGDTLLIQFGHNDSKSDDNIRYTSPATDYKDWLRRYIASAHAHGAQPVLITPVTRRKFENDVLVDTHAPYAQAMREVAVETKTPLIDLTADSMKWIANLGERASRQYYLVFTPDQHIPRFPDGHEDNTHFSEMGARKVAELVAARLAQLNLPISQRVKATRPGLTRDTPLGGPSCSEPFTVQPEPLLAFPGAEGAGRFATGGRGGVVLKVTNLRDSGPGSLRAAIDATGPRTILFDVSGTIALESPLKIVHGQVTLAGQSAPGDGITLKNFPLLVSADDVIIRYIRSRLDDERRSESDAIWINGGRRIMLDHVPASGSVDETLSARSRDSDGDGVPDAWEKAHGLNPDKPDGRNRVDGNGYTNLENYLNDLVPQRLPTKAADAAPGLIFVLPSGVRYPTLQSAIDALPAEGGEITLSPGVYREKIVIDKPHVRLQGVGARAQEVVIAWGDGAINAGGTFKSATLHIAADDFRADNLTIQNDYSLRSTQPSQAVALSVVGDRAIFTRVRLLGAQDTLYAGAKKCTAGAPCRVSRQYFKDCYIEGHVDFIFGDSKAFFDHCEIHALAHEEVLLTAHARSAADEDRAYVFDHCIITADAAARNIYFGRPWRDYAAVVFMNTDVRANLNPAGWREWHPGETQRLQTAYYAEYGSTGWGGSMDAREPRSHKLSATDAAKWAMKPFLAADDGWTPDLSR